MKPTLKIENATNVGHDAKGRAAVVEALSAFLASTYVLYQKSLFYHWNVTGPHFGELHALFEQHYEDLHKAGDIVAERIRALGYTAPGTFADFLSLSEVSEDKSLPKSEKKMLENLLASHELCSREAARIFAIAEKAEDAVTADLMVQRMNFHDKAAWMLRALLA